MPERLTQREREILDLVAAGKTSKEIGESLKVSATTIASHRKNICRKLRIHSTAALIRYAVTAYQGTPDRLLAARGAESADSEVAVHYTRQRRKEC